MGNTHRSRPGHAALAVVLAIIAVQFAALALTSAATVVLAGTRLEGLAWALYVLVAGIGIGVVIEYATGLARRTATRRALVDHRTLAQGLRRG